jgi:predicted metal-dependent phosphotriesterase family hydrolase
LDQPRPSPRQGLRGDTRILSRLVAIGPGFPSDAKASTAENRSYLNCESGSKADRCCRAAWISLKTGEDAKRSYRHDKRAGISETNGCNRHRAGESHAVILEDEGMTPSRVSFDHSDGSGDMDYFLGLVRRGYSLGMDHVHRGIGPNVKPSFERRAECIKLLVDAGFAGKIFFSQDSEFGGSLHPAEKREWRDKLDPPDGMLFNTRKLIPYLKRIGVSDRNIHTITVENPRSFFAVP